MDALIACKYLDERKMTAFVINSIISLLPILCCKRKHALWLLLFLMYIIQRNIQYLKLISDILYDHFDINRILIL